MSEGLEWGRHAPQKVRNESYNQKTREEFSWGILGKLLSPMTLAHVRNGAQCHQQGQVQPTNLGQQGAKGAHSSRRASPLHTHTPGAQAQKKPLNNKYQQQCDSYAQSRGLPKPAGNLIPNMQMGTLRNARPGQGRRSSSCSSTLPVP